MEEERIELFLEEELGYLNLTEKQKKNFIKHYKKMTRYIEKYHWEYTPEELLIQDFNNWVDFFQRQGFDEEISTNYAKALLVESDRKNIKQLLCFLRVLNLEEAAISENYLTVSRLNLEEAHATKMFFIESKPEVEHTGNLITKPCRFRKKYDPNMPKLLHQYPLTKETIDIWLFIGSMNDQDFQEYFHMSRQQLSEIYPTTKEEIAVLHKLAEMTDEEIKETYGIERVVLLNKHPINLDTLKALKTIVASSDKAIKNVLKMSKQEAFQLRTITTEMIRKANQEFRLQQKTYTKEELKSLFKQRKRY